MRKTNDIVSTRRHTSLPYFPRFCCLILSVLLLSAANAGADTLFIDLPIRKSDDTKYATIATGVPFKVGVYKSNKSVKGLSWGSGKIALPTGFKYDSTREQVKLIDAKVDDPSIFEIVGREGGIVTLQGKLSGETTLRVKARGKLGNTETGDATIRTAAPNRVQLTPTCDDARAKARAPILVPTGLELDLTEELYSDTTPLMTTSFPEVDFGTLVPVALKKGQDTWKTEHLRGAHTMLVKTTAAGTKTSFKVPALGYELPVQVYELSAISEIRVVAPETMCMSCGRRQINIDILVGGEIPCVRPSISFDVAVKPASVCRRWEDLSKKKTDSSNNTYDLPNPEPLYIVGSALGTCTVTVEARGTGKSGSAQIRVEK